MEAAVREGGRRGGGDANEEGRPPRGRPSSFEPVLQSDQNSYFTRAIIDPAHGGGAGEGAVRLVQHVVRG
jgi:hypothetical protein